MVQPCLQSIHGLNAIPVPGTRRDSLYLLAVVLEQETELEPKEIMADTAGYTDTIFGIFHLLGYQFSSRIADVGGSRFWRVDRKAAYGVLNDLTSNKINMKLIAEQWDDLLRPAGSLKLGVVQASGLTRTLQTNDRPTRLARALQELGRLIKTLYLLRNIDDEHYRGASSFSSIAAKDATNSPAASFMASAGNCAGATAKARKISSARSASSSTSSFYGTPSIWQRCQMHFVRNALALCGRQQRPLVLRLMKTITEAPAARGSRGGAGCGDCGAREEGSQSGSAAGGTWGRDPGRLRPSGGAPKTNAHDQYAGAACFNLWRFPRRSSMLPLLRAESLSG